MSGMTLGVGMSSMAHCGSSSVTRILPQLLAAGTNTRARFDIVNAPGGEPPQTITSADGRPPSAGSLNGSSTEEPVLG